MLNELKETMDKIVKEARKRIYEQNKDINKEKF
jgi:hypothetical protein